MPQEATEMIEPNQRRRGRCTPSEHGGARLNFVLIIAAIALVGYAAYNYAPVSYNAFLFKDVMQETVNKGAYMPGKTPEWVEAELRAAGKEYGLPPEMKVNVQNEGGRVIARVQWMQPVSMPGFTYHYEFDHTARSGGFMNAK